MPGPLRIGAGRLRRHSGGAGHLQNRQRAAEAAAAASAAAASEAAKAAEEEAARAASEAAEAARQEEERRAAEAAAAKRAEQVTAAQAEHDSVQYGDKLGRIWVEGTNVDCALYWGDSEGQFGRGAGCRAESDCVLPGENGTVFIGGHTGTYFSDLGSTQLGAIIHLETDWGDFTYKVTDMQVIQETDVDKGALGCRGAQLHPVYLLPLWHPDPHPQRYAVYADPVSADEYGVVPAEATENKMTEVHPPQGMICLGHFLDHLLELRAVVCLGRDGTVNVVRDDGDAILFPHRPYRYRLWLLAGASGWTHPVLFHRGWVYIKPYHRNSL